MEKLENFLRENGCFDVTHSGRSLGDHLINTAQLLELMEVPQHVVYAGGLHSIYGTNAFKKKMKNEEDRFEIAYIFGEKAERLAFIFGKIDRPKELEKVSDLGGVVSGKDSAGVEYKFNLSRNEVRELRLIEVANLLEQESNVAKFPNMLKVFENQMLASLAEASRVGAM